MHRELLTDPWKIIEQGFDPDAVMASESLFSIGNGVMGGRANFEEQYSGKTLQGNYIGGVYYPDKTRVGWWKNGYPDYFAKVLNSAFWEGVRVTVGGLPLDLAHCPISGFRRELDMQQGLLKRNFTARVAEVTVEVEAERFVSLARPELAALCYRITLPAEAAEVELEAYVEGDVRNEDANYDEKFWELIDRTDTALTMRTKKSGFGVCWAQQCRVDAPETVAGTVVSVGERIAERYAVQLKAGQSVTICKYVGVASSLNHPAGELSAAAMRVASEAAAAGYIALREEQCAAWRHKWDACDIRIEGDDKAQQGIRFCIFQLLQTYTGIDSRLNVGPKGFTGEKYGGSTYWDTEAYCLPFYLSTSGETVARQLLRYRYNQLEKAIENGEKLGFTDGAALYPMVTMTGEECHNEWEITFEEIHRNGTIAYAIYNYCRYTGTRDYLVEGGLEVLIGIARFWAQRATYSAARTRYVILAVTGPNEYENNVNNNWYTNYIAVWSMRYAAECADYVREHYPAEYSRIEQAVRLDPGELLRWQIVADGMYLHEIESDQEGILFMQQDGYLDKEQRMAADLPVAERPINQNWSWDRILRSCFIKQADVLQGIYYFQEEFDLPTIRRNFDFYEPRTVHESSLSPCVHSILASVIGDPKRAYELYLRTSRLDLDDYNREVHEGLHITSMAGSWLSVVEGFGGVRIGRNGRMNVTPRLPHGWKSLNFKLNYRGALLRFEIEPNRLSVCSENGTEALLTLCGADYTVSGSTVTVHITE